MAKTVIKTEKLTKVFSLPLRRVEVLKGVDLTVKTKEFVLIFGPSGCGKTTLLNLILGLDVPSSGKVFVRGKNLALLSSAEKASFRRKKFGVVYQQSFWLKSLNVLDNVALPLSISGFPKEVAREEALTALEEIKMAKFAPAHPNELSSGEQQMIALARAIVASPWLVIADEPTGNLDTRTGHQLMEVLATLNKHKQRTILLVTHNQVYLPYANHKVAMKDGQIIGEFKSDFIPPEIAQKLGQAV